MTKLLYCEDCGDIISPHRQRNRSRVCACGRHAVWWEDPQAGELRLCDLESFTNETGIPTNPRAFVIGLHNGLLRDPSSLTTFDAVAVMLTATPETYVFKKAMSLAIKLRPGMTGDTRWAKQRPEQQVSVR